MSVNDHFRFVIDLPSFRFLGKTFTMAPELCAAAVFSTAGGRSGRLIFRSCAIAGDTSKAATILMMLMLRRFIGQPL